MEILELVLYYASMWGPSIVSILGILATVIFGLGKVVKAIQSWQDAADKETSAAEQLHADMKQLIGNNRNLQAYNQKLLEEITRIKGYDIKLEVPEDESK